jgi:hypothetical protein
LRFFVLALVLLIAKASADDQAHLGLLSIYELPAWKALLHYKSDESVIGAGSAFFLSHNGHKDPQAELKATIEALKNDPKTQCKYPARLDFLLKNGAIDKNDLPKSNCGDYKIYLQKVPFDRVYAVFVAEDQAHPASIMGHTILKIAGEDSDGITREHSFSFMALMGENGNLKRYINAVLNGSEGSYVLAPYQKTIETYIDRENRSLWEFELNLTSEAKDRLKKHLWELKETPILYQFITHNCNTAIEAILNAADQSFSDDKYWFFSTPIEYLQDLSEKGNIENVYLHPSKSERESIAFFGAYYPLNTPRSSRISIEGFKRGVRIGVSPVYRDKRSISNASAIEYDSKLLEIKARFDEDGASLETLNFISMESIGDYRAIGLSKAFRLALEENGRDRLGGAIEWGRGVGFSPLSGATIYSVGKIGAGYDGKADFFAAIDTGIIARLGDDAKLLANYERFWDSDKKYRGFNGALNAFAAFALSRDFDIHIGLERNFNDQNDRARTIISFGFSRYF